MPKSKPKLEKNALAVWYGPLTTFHKQRGLFGNFAGKTVVLSGEGRMHDPFRLDLVTEQERLFNEYVAIKDGNDAQAWVECNGFPALIPKPSEKKFRAEENIATIIDSAACLRKLVAINKALQEVTRGAPLNRFISLIERVTIKQLQRRLIKGIVVLKIGDGFWRDQPAPLFKEMFGAYCSNGKNLTVVPLTLVTFNRTEWVRNQRDYLSALARDVLVQAANIMLEGVRPLLEWTYSGSEDKWYLSYEYRVSCPWQAIAAEFCRIIGRRVVTPRTCCHPDCGESLENHKYGAKTCGKERCKKWYQRHKHELVRL